MSAMEDGSSNDESFRRRAVQALGRVKQPDSSGPAITLPDLSKAQDSNDSTVEELEYEMGDQPTVIMPDGKRRSMTPEERSEITRVEAMRLARQDSGLPDEDIPPAPGMPRFRLRQLDQWGQPNRQQEPQIPQRLTPTTRAAASPDTTPTPTGADFTPVNEIANSPDKLAQFKAKSYSDIKGLLEAGLITPERADSWRAKVDAASHPDTIASVKDFLLPRREEAAKAAAKERKTPLSDEQITAEKERLKTLLAGKPPQEAAKLIRAVEDSKAKTARGFLMLEKKILGPAQDLGGPPESGDNREERPRLDGWGRQIVAGAWTGRNTGQGTEHYWEHEDYPGRRFSQAEYDQLTRPRPPAGDPPNEPPDRPEGSQRRRRDGLDLGRIIGNAPERGSYAIDKRRYVGIKIKDIRTEILTNERDAQLFGEMLKKLGHPDPTGAIERYRKGNPKPEDTEFMTYAAHEFSRGLTFGEEAGAMMKPKDVDLIGLLANRDQSFLDLKTHEGKFAPEIIKSLILHMAMRDPDGVADLRTTLKAMQKDRETHRYTRAEEKIVAQSKRLKLDRKDWGVVINYSNPVERMASKRQLAEHIRKNANAFRRAIDWIERYKPEKGRTGSKITMLGSSRYAALSAIKEAERGIMPAQRSIVRPTSWVMSRIDEHLADVVRYLGPTIENPEMRSLIAQETLSNKNAKLDIERGPRTFEQLQSLNKEERFSETSIENHIRQRIQETPDWGSSSTSEDVRSEKLNDWKAEEKRKVSGGGFFAWLFSIDFDRKWNKAAPKARTPR